MVANRRSNRFFNPRRVSSLGFWVRPGYSWTPKHSSNAVYELIDIGGNGITTAQGTGAKQPATNTRTLNSKNVLDLVGANSQTIFDTTNAVATALSGTNKAFALFCVAQRDNAANTNRLITLERASTSTPLLSLYINSSLSNKISVQRRDDAATLLRADGVTSVDTNPHIISCRFDGTDCKIYLDGVLESTTNLSGLGNVTLDTIRLGNFFDIAGNFFDGAIADAAIFIGNPTDAEFDKVIGELAWFNGLEGNLAGGHPYKNYAPRLR